jgi:hypothetical protein
MCLSIISPLARLNNKKKENFVLSLNTGKVPQNAQSRIKTEQVGQTQNHHHYSPVNIYFGENFSVRLQQWFKFLALIENNSTGGIIHCHFTPNRKLATMNLSADGIKIRDVPNAGGSSVNSEVMSFEILQKCFKGKLLKVRKIRKNNK